GLGGPEPLRIRTVLPEPAEEAGHLTSLDRVGAGAVGRLSPAVIAVQQAGTGGAAVGRQRNERRHHGRNVHPDDVDVRAHLRVRGAYTIGPRRVDVVRELFRAVDAYRMRDTHRHDHI